MLRSRRRCCCGLCHLSPAGDSAHLAARPATPAVFAQRQRRHPAQRVDPGVGRASVAPRSRCTCSRPTSSIRRTTRWRSLSRSSCRRCMGAPLSLGGRVPGARLQPGRHRRLALTAFATFVLVEAWTGSFLAGLLAGSALRVQHPHAHPLRARAGHPHLRAAAGAAGDRSTRAGRVLAAPRCCWPARSR